MEPKKMLAELKAAGVTQEQIAAHCECAQSYISRLWTQPIDPRYSLVKRLEELHSRTICGKNSA